MFDHVFGANTVRLQTESREIQVMLKGPLEISYFAHTCLTLC